MRPPRSRKPLAPARNDLSQGDGEAMTLHRNKRRSSRVPETNMTNHVNDRSRDGQSNDQVEGQGVISHLDQHLGYIWSVVHGSIYFHLKDVVHHRKQHGRPRELSDILCLGDRVRYQATGQSRRSGCSWKGSKVTFIESWRDVCLQNEEAAKAGKMAELTPGYGIVTNAFAEGYGFIWSEELGRVYFTKDSYEKRPMEKKKMSVKIRIKDSIKFQAVPQNCFSPSCRWRAVSMITVSPDFVVSTPGIFAAYARVYHIEKAWGGVETLTASKVKVFFTLSDYHVRAQTLWSELALNQVMEVAFVAQPENNGFCYRAVHIRPALKFGSEKSLSLAEAEAQIQKPSYSQAVKRNVKRPESPQQKMVGEFHLWQEWAEPSENDQSATRSWSPTTSKGRRSSRSSTRSRATSSSQCSPKPEGTKDFAILSPPPSQAKSVSESHSGNADSLALTGANFAQILPGYPDIELCCSVLCSKASDFPTQTRSPDFAALGPDLSHWSVLRNNGKDLPSPPLPGQPWPDGLELDHNGNAIGGGRKMPRSPALNFCYPERLGEVFRDERPKQSVACQTFLSAEQQLARQVFCNEEFRNFVVTRFPQIAVAIFESYRGDCY